MKKPIRKTASGKSNTGILVAVLALVVIVIVVALLLLLRKPPARARQTQTTGPLPHPSLQAIASAAGAAEAEAACLSNFKQVALAMLMFADAHGNKFPKADHWVDDISPFIKDASVLKCPEDKSGARSSYAMNSALSGLSINQIANPGSLVAIFETEKPGDNPSGGPESVIKTPRHPGGVEYGFADGHVTVTKEIPNFDPSK